MWLAVIVKLPPPLAVTVPLDVVPSPQLIVAVPVLAEALGLGSVKPAVKVVIGEPAVAVRGLIVVLVNG